MRQVAFSSSVSIAGLSTSSEDLERFRRVEPASTAGSDYEAAQTKVAQNARLIDDKELTRLIYYLIIGSPDIG